ncbi:helix-turn-helix transcriptional regulator [Gilvibacter sediminis]|uniref:helix-turn-helix transcriptional regulator n=1 Tax=Gilvibacter sediminis TaxID=379071 RepID=UPI0023508CD6|nr:helix-turn-helix domain-containing protein [Gilvibacter sediminis]MDC7997375.1 helix-turn-helix domain-containing protein [Gilvibacter sediminis]
MNMGEIKSLFNYHKFERLFLNEFNQYLKENNLSAGSIDTLDNAHQKNFHSFFLLRQTAQMETLLHDAKDEILRMDKTSFSIVENHLQGISKQREIWKTKIQNEHSFREEHSASPWKLIAYDYYFEYAELYKRLIVQLKELAEDHFAEEIELMIDWKLNSSNQENTRNSGNGKSELMTINEVAEYLKVTRRQIYNLEENGHISRVNTVGARSVRFLRSDIEAYAKGN